MARHFDALMLGSIELFCLSAEHESFTAAAVSAGLTPAAVSRAVGRLETRLGVRLFVRSTRRIRLTDAGRGYYERCRRSLGGLIEAEHEISDGQRKPTGTVRISLPTGYGHHRVLPVLPTFRREYPGIALDIQLSSQNVDFTVSGCDLAIRARTLPDSGLTARKIEDADLVIVAAPDYLRRHGTPTTLDALTQHECIQFLLPSSGQPLPWLLKRKGRNVELATTGALCCADDILGPVTLARSGAGIAQAYRFSVAEDLRQGRLKEVLREFGGATRPFSLLHPANQHLPLRVKVLKEFLLRQLAMPQQSERDTR